MPLLLINGGRRRGVSGPSVEMKQGSTPTAGLHTVNTAKGRRSVPRLKCSVEENMWESFASWHTVSQASQSVNESSSQ